MLLLVQYLTKVCIENGTQEMDTSSGIDFLFNGRAVGVLDPATIGILTYMPYRSGPHYDMQRAIDAGDSPTCTYVRDGIEHSFVLDSCPAYGQLAVRDLRSV